MRPKAALRHGPLISPRRTARRFATDIKGHVSATMLLEKYEGHATDSYPNHCLCGSGATHRASTIFAPPWAGSCQARLARLSSSDGHRILTPNGQERTLAMARVVVLALSQRLGCRSRTALADSSSDATCSSVTSASQVDTSCTPIGMPSRLLPNRIDMPGKPVRFSGTVEPCLVPRPPEASSDAYGDVCSQKTSAHWASDHRSD